MIRKISVLKLFVNIVDTVLYYRDSVTSLTITGRIKFDTLMLRTAGLNLENVTKSKRNMYLIKVSFHLSFGRQLPAILLS